MDVKERIMSERSRVYALVRELGLKSAERIAYIGFVLSFTVALLACGDDRVVEGGVDASDAVSPDASGHAF